MTISVVIVDDQALVRSGLAMILDSQADIEVIAQCSNGLEAIEAARQYQPDLMLMDIRMPEMDGLTAIDEILNGLNLACRIIVLSTFDLDEYVYRALRLGASGFILKDTPPQELISAVNNVAKDGAMLSPSITKRLIGSFANSQEPSPIESETLNLLTEREREVLVTLARGYTNLEISERLYISEATVKSHVSNLLSKLDLRDRVQAVIFAYEQGLIKAGEA